MRIADAAGFTFFSLASHRLRTFLTALGIAIGIAAVILLTSIGEGLHRFVIAEFTQFGTNIISVTPGRIQTRGLSLGAVNTIRPLSVDDALALRRAPHVQVTDPAVQGNGEVVFAGRTRRVTIYGVGADFARAFSMRVAAGEFLPQDDPRAPRALVVLGSKVARELFGARFEPRGIAIGTAYIFGLLLVATVGMDPARSLDHYPEIVAAVSLLISVVVLSSALAESDRAFRRRSTLDPLTGSFNRNALDQRLAELEGHPISNAEGVSFGFLLCDLDHFKQVNDEHGHEAGNEVLRAVSAELKAAVRASDLAARYGGDEFVVILTRTRQDGAERVAEKIREGVENVGRRLGYLLGAVTVSIGIAEYDPHHPTGGDLLVQADRALYRAKSMGRNTVVGSLLVEEKAAGKR